MPHHPGLSRSSVRRDHALITPESHVPIEPPGWRGVEAVALISAELGASFAQYRVRCEPDAEIGPLAGDREYLVLVRAGDVVLDVVPDALAAGGYAYLPPARSWCLQARAASELILFEKRYVPLAGTPAPEPLAGDLGAVPAEPFLGDEAARLQTLLPATPAFDWAVNVFEFDPGATLPQVESHFMQHGLYMLAGQGVYRLGEHWYPVQAGDSIWMAPYLLQWFAATGKQPTRYVYYKEMNRAPHA